MGLSTEDQGLPAPEGAIQKSESESLSLLEPDDRQTNLGEQKQADDTRDELFDEAVQVVSEAGRGSVTILQRKLRVGYNRASRLVEQLEAADILGPDRGRSQGREVYLQTAGENDPERGEGETPPLLTSPSSTLEHNDGTVDNEQAELPPPPEDDDAPPRIWM